MKYYLNYVNDLLWIEHFSIPVDIDKLSIKYQLYKKQHDSQIVFYAMFYAPAYYISIY